jgi:cytochrome c-type biogenesis protein CcmI
VAALDVSASGRGAQRAFLERSLADLDQELAAGDLEPDDHARLRADYERRLAALDRPGKPPAGRAGRARPRFPFVAVGLVVLVAVLSGVLLAQAVGRRGAGDNVTGIDLTPEEAAGTAPGTATTLPTDLQACLQATGSAAVRCFIDYTRVHPDDARGFMHFGLFSISQGLELENDDLLSGGESFLRRAMEIDPALFDARVNLAVYLERSGRDDEAREVLAPLAGQELPTDLQQLVDFVEQNLAAG